MSEITKVDPSDAGCWIDGHWGRFGSSRLLSIADDYNWPGYNDSDLLIAINCLSSDEGCDEYIRNPFGCICVEIICDAADEAEAWLNDNVAPEGFSFGWYDGEFFLWSDETWQES